MSELSRYLSMPFVQYALIVTIFVALSASLLGVTLVMKRFSYIGDGLSHVAFGAMAIASVMKLTNQMVLIMPVTILGAVLLLRTGQNTKIKGDAAIAMVSVGSLAIGYLLMSKFSTSANLAGDVCSTLFGSSNILTLSVSDVWLSVAVSLFVVGVFVFFYEKIFAVTFDETFAASAGVGVKRYNLLISIVIAVVIVLGMNMIGSLLISALIIFPALSAMRVFGSFLSVTLCSVAIGLVSAVSGIIISLLAVTPVGPTIVAVDIVIFAFFWVLGRVRGIA